MRRSTTIYVGAGTISIAGTVIGDASVAGGTVTMTGTVDGSLNVSGGSVDVLGEVTGAVRSLGEPFGSSAPWVATS